MSSIPFWRRMSPQRAAARATAFAAFAAVAAFAYLLVAVPLIEQLADAERRAAAMDRRADAMRAAAADRLAEAEVAAPPAASLAEAGAYLNAFAPIATKDAAMLDLLSALRLIAQTAEVRLTTVAPLDLARSEARLFAFAPDQGLSLLAAEARIVADHNGLRRFLEAIEQARPALRAAAIDITARTPRVEQEDDRLTARVLVGAFIREGAQ